MLDGVEGWKHLFISLGLSLEGYKGLSLETNDGMITLRFSSAEEAVQFQALFHDKINSPEILRNGVSSRLRQDSAVIAENVLSGNSAIAVPAPAIGEGIPFLEGILGRSYPIMPGVRIHWKDLFLEIPDVTALVSSEPLDAGQKKTWEGWVASIMKTLCSKPLAQLHAEYLNLDCLDPSSNFMLDQSLVETCFGFREHHGETHLYLDYGRLYSLIFPPACKQEGAALTFDQQHFITYLKQVFSDSNGALLAADVEGDGISHPVLLPVAASEILGKAIVFLLDNTGSLNGVVEIYKQKIRELLETVGDHYGEYDKMYVQTFSASCSRLLAFDPRDSASIETILAKITCNGRRTAVYKALDNVFEDPLVQLYKTQVSCVLITDGQDNHSDSEEKARVREASKFTDRTPAVFTFAIGEVDEAGCSELATLTGGQYFKGDDVAGLDALKEHLSAVSRPRSLYHIVSTEFDEYVPVYDSPVVLEKLSLRNEDRVTVNDAVLAVDASLPVVDAAVVPAPDMPVGLSAFFSAAAADKATEPTASGNKLGHRQTRSA